MSNWNRNWYILESRKSVNDLVVYSLLAVSVLSGNSGLFGSVDWSGVSDLNIQFLVSNDRLVDFLSVNFRPGNIDIFNSGILTEFCWESFWSSIDVLVF